jgi:hypothetical protein
LSEVEKEMQSIRRGQVEQKRIIGEDKQGKGQAGESISRGRANRI